jgi:UDP-glucose 4-epimerase
MKEKPNILILGGGGFIGHALAVRMAGLGHHVTRVDCKEMPALYGSPAIICDLADAGTLHHLLDQCDTVVHLASTTTPATSAGKPTMEIEGNITPTLRLLETLRQTSLRHLIYISSGGTLYGNPMQLPATEATPPQPHSYHAAGKIAAEAFLEAFGHASNKVITVLRPSNIYGPGQPLRSGFGIIRNMLENLRLQAPITIWGDGGNIRDYLFIDDLVYALEGLIARGHEQGAYNVGAGIGTSINELLGIAEKVTGRQARVEHKPARPMDVRSIVLDSTKLTHATGWRPRTQLEDGIRRTWQWLNAP